LVVQDHQVSGGLCSAIAELLSVQHPCKVDFVGVSDTFGESGQPGELWDKYGLSATHISQKILKLCKK